MTSPQITLGEPNLAEHSPYWPGRSLIGRQAVLDGVIAQLPEDYDNFTIHLQRVVGCGDYRVGRGPLHRHREGNGQAARRASRTRLGLAGWQDRALAAVRRHLAVRRRDGLRSHACTFVGVRTPPSYATPTVRSEDLGAPGPGPPVTRVNPLPLIALTRRNRHSSAAAQRSRASCSRGLRRRCRLACTAPLSGAWAWRAWPGGLCRR